MICWSAQLKRFFKGYGAVESVHNDLIKVTCLHPKTRKITWQGPQRSWNNVLFTDDSQFLVNLTDGRRVLRWRGEQFCQELIQLTVLVEEMSWYRVESRHTIALHHIMASLYCDKITTMYVLPYLAHRSGFFQHNAQPNATRLTLTTLCDNEINVLWRPSSLHLQCSKNGRNAPWNNLKYYQINEMSMYIVIQARSSRGHGRYWSNLNTGFYQVSWNKVISLT